MRVSARVDASEAVRGPGHAATEAFRERHRDTEAHQHLKYTVDTRIQQHTRHLCRERAEAPTHSGNKSSTFEGLTLQQRCTYSTDTQQQQRGTTDTRSTPTQTHITTQHNTAMPKQQNVLSQTHNYSTTSSTTAETPQHLLLAVAEESVQQGDVAFL